MRFSVSAGQVEQLATRVGAYMPAVPRAQLLDVVSQGLGYRDWSEISSSPNVAADGKPFPVRIRPELLGTGPSSSQEELQRVQQQIHEAFANAPFANTCAMVYSPAAFFATLERIGIGYGYISSVKSVRIGRSSTQTNSPFYRLSLTDAFDLRRASEGALLAEQDNLVAKQVPGPMVDHDENPEMKMLAFKLSHRLTRAAYFRWERATFMHSHDAPAHDDGRIRTPFAIACSPSDCERPEGAVLGRWKVVTPSDAPKFTASVRLHAVSLSAEGVAPLLGLAIAMLVTPALEMAIWAMTGCPDASICVRIELGDNTSDQRDVGKELHKWVEDNPGFVAARGLGLTVKVSLVSAPRLGGCPPLL